VGFPLWVGLRGGLASATSPKPSNYYKAWEEGLVARTEAQPDTRLPNWYSEKVRSNTETVMEQVKGIDLLSFWWPQLLYKNQ